MLESSGNPVKRRSTLRILVSNDDGIYAPGLRALAMRLAAEPGNVVYVVAPDSERSATGHALTMHHPVWVKEVELDKTLAGSWLTTGTPSDCVKFGVRDLLKDSPVDYIISGINNGANLGSEILYSGTVSAAIEGAMLGVPSIAISLASNTSGSSSSSPRHFDLAADVLARLLAILPGKLGGKLLLNVNVPNVPPTCIRGVSITRLGVRAYNDWFEKRTDPRGRVYYWLAGEAIEEGEEEGTDAHAVFNSYISVTPLSFDMTDVRVMGELSAFNNLDSLSLAGKESSEHRDGGGS
jgi:5'-nucleotidase